MRNHRRQSAPQIRETGLGLGRVAPRRIDGGLEFGHEWRNPIQNSTASIIQERNMYPSVTSVVLISILSSYMPNAK
jgi:hypothetical protein